MLTVETWPVERLIPYARNPRKNDAVEDRMCGAIKEFGFRIPIIAKSDGTVVDGHLRLKAAQRLRMSTLPVITRGTVTFGPPSDRPAQGAGPRTSEHPVRIIRLLSQG